MMFSEVEALTSQIQSTTDFISRLFSRKFGFVMIAGICLGVILNFLFS